MSNPFNNETMLSGNAVSVVMKVAYSIRKAAKIFNKNKFTLRGTMKKSEDLAITAQPLANDAHINIGQIDTGIDYSLILLILKTN